MTGSSGRRHGGRRLYGSEPAQPTLNRVNAPHTRRSSLTGVSSSAQTVPRPGPERLPPPIARTRAHARAGTHPLDGFARGGAWSPGRAHARTLETSRTVPHPLVVPIGMGPGRAGGDAYVLPRARTRARARPGYPHRRRDDCGDGPDAGRSSRAPLPGSHAASMLEPPIPRMRLTWALGSTKQLTRDRHVKVIELACVSDAAASVKRVSPVAVQRVQGVR
jgi:hypothetical protein